MAAGCGLGPGAGLDGVTLTVTRDFGAHSMRAPGAVGATEADSVMRVLERNADISTRYGGGFVQSIDGLEGSAAGEPRDWFYYVNGIEAPVGAAAYELHGGEAIWWDYRDWSATQHVPAVVGSWPRPLLGGYEGNRPPVVLECRGGGRACGIARERLRAAGVHAGSSSSSGDAISVLVGPWSRLRDDSAAAQIEHGPAASGVYAQISDSGGEAGCAIEALDENGDTAARFGAGAGIVAATRRYEGPPVWVVSGCDEAGAAAAARLLDTADLRDRYAVLPRRGGGVAPLPLAAGGSGS